MILVIDNYDSFTYNLVHLLAQNLARNLTRNPAPSVVQALTPNVDSDDVRSSRAGESGLVVHRNDKITVEHVAELHPEGILISPGPGRPADAGITCEVIEKLGERIPILGVCLGHQAIGEVFGGSITYAPTLMHGKTSTIVHDGRSIFKDVPPDFVATRYHSLVVSEDDLPECLEVSARTPDGVIMGFRHRSYAIEGIQFHPESLLTVEGHRIIANWVNSLRVAAA